jgi:hypothetical protein
VKNLMERQQAFLSMPGGEHRACSLGWVARLSASSSEYSTVRNPDAFLMKCQELAKDCIPLTSRATMVGKRQGPSKDGNGGLGMKNGGNGRKRRRLTDCLDIWTLEEAPHRKTISRAAIVLLLILSLGFVCPSGGYAATLTVCASGCKYTTIAAAVAVAKPGSTIKILDAVHTESNITLGRSLIIAGRGASKTAVDGGARSPGNENIFVVDPGVTTTFQDLTIRNASLDGLDNHLGSVSINNSTISACIFGTGISNQGGTLRINNSTIEGNGGPYSGVGGIDNDGGKLTINNSTIFGGARSVGSILNEHDGTLSISNSTISGGGDGTGAIANCDTSSVTAIGSSVSNGSTLFGVAGIYNAGTFTIINSTVSGNQSICGDGGIANSGTLAISFSTITNNVAEPTSVGGLHVYSGKVTVKNSVIGDNSDGDCSGTITALGANLDTDGSCGTTNFTQVTSAQLNLGPLTLNAPGTTDTQALLPGSVAIDAVTDCTDVDGNRVTTDQRGAPRPDGEERVCDTGAFRPDGEERVCDIGAFETQARRRRFFRCTRF